MTKRIKRKKNVQWAEINTTFSILWICRDPKGSQVSLRSTKSSLTVVPDEEGNANDEENVEETANNLEQKLEPDEANEEQVVAPEENDDSNDNSAEA